jgi:hypothetical protein
MKFKVLILIILIIIILGSLICGTMLLGVYNPMASVFSRGGPQIRIEGHVVRNGTSAVGVKVEIYATDQLFQEEVLTDAYGWFTSNNLYNPGQKVILYIEGFQFVYFIPYFISAESGDRWSIGTFDIGG